MNKTVTVNIGGMVFHIEELAYEKMKKYLEAIRGYFTSSDGRDEIIQDIESRMAEMFSERIGTNRQVVTEEDVDFVINAMGKPEQVAGEDDDAGERTSSRTAESTINEKGYRRLYRDPDDKVVSGVCSGFAHYVGIDPIWVRLAFAVAFFVFGSGLLLYILLAIIIPKAQNAAEKLEMRGQPVNISNIKKTIEDEVEDIKSRLDKNNFRAGRRSGQSTIARFFEGLGQILLAILKFFFKFIAFIFMFALFIIVIALFICALSLAGVMHWGDMPVALTEAYLSDGQRWLVIISALLTLGVPAIMLLYKVIKMLFNIKIENRYINMSAGILVGIGIVFSIFTIADISKEYRYKEVSRTNIPIVQPKNNTLYIDVTDGESYRDETYYDNKWEVEDEWSSIDLTGDTLIISHVKLDVVRTDGKDFELMKITSARGKDRKLALNNARSISYEIIQEDSLLKLSEQFSMLKSDKYRDQRVQLVLKVPVGKSVFLSKNSDDIVYDIKNVTNTWDHDMVGRTWTMTEKGLECIGCNLEDESDGHVKVKVNGRSVEINGGDEDTIDWDDKDVKIRISEDGVLIDAKDKK